MDLPRQPQPVHVTFEGEPEDIRYYATIIQRYIQGQGDNCEYTNGGLTIYPYAVND